MWLFYLLLGALRRFPLAKAQMNEGKFNSAFSFLDARDRVARRLALSGQVASVEPLHTRPLTLWA